jgi:cytochrome P450
MDSPSTNTTLARPFDDMPIVDLPEDYPYHLPEYLAERAETVGPIFRRRIPPQMAPMFGEWMVYMVGPEANRFVLHTHRDHFSHDLGWSPTIGGMFEKGLLNTDDPEHARDRKMMNPAFAISYMSRYLPIMTRVIADRTADWAQRGELDVYQETRKITFDVAAECLVGFQTGAQVDRLRELFYQIMYASMTDSFTSEQDFYAKMTGVRDELNGMLLSMIAARRKSPTDDILGLLVAARDEDEQPFTDRQLLGQLHILLLAGHETTTTLSAWLLRYLAERPEHLSRLRQEIRDALAETNGEVTLDTLRAMPALGRAVDESGRLRSPVGNVPRGVVKDFAFGGYRVPAGTRVLLSLVASHYLKEFYANPQEWDPDRFAPPREEGKVPYSLVTFGGGPRICIGINFAQVEIKAMAAHILPRFDLAPAGEDGVQVYFSPAATILGGVPLRVSRAAL